MRTTTGAIVAATLLAAAGSANAGKLLYSDLAEGPESQFITIDGVQIGVRSQPRGTAYEPGNGGIGVDGGAADEEIGGLDYIQFNFSEAVDLRRIEVNKLYSSASDTDFINEGITFTTDYGSFTFVTSDVDEGTVLDLPDFGGEVINLSSPDNSGSGRWKFRGDSLFGGPITFLRIQADSYPSALPQYASDFSFWSLNLGSNPVPTPGAAALLALGGLTTLRRRR